MQPLTKKPLEIRIWSCDPDPILSAMCLPIHENEFGTPELEDFGRQLTEMMFKGDGWGLAASQVSVLRRVFVMQFPDHTDLKPMVVCNPVITLEGVEVEREEGCLSVPNVRGVVTRASAITMTFRRPSGEAADGLLQGMDARVAQHETDHLNGIMFFDTMDKVGRRKVLKKWEKELPWELRRRERRS